MKSAAELKHVHNRIQLLQGQKKLLREEFLELNEKEGRTKDENKHLANIQKLHWSLIYEVRGLQLKLHDLREQVIAEIVNS